MSFQLVSYDFCLNSLIDSVWTTLLNMTVVFVSFVCFIEDEIIRQIGKWSDMFLLKMAVLKTVSVKKFLKIWSIAVAVLSLTLVGLFIVGIIPFL